MSDSQNKKSVILSFVEKIKSNKKLYYAVVACLIVIIALILFGNVFSENKNTETTDSVNEYVVNLENRLTKLLSKVEGVGKASVAITVESGMETVLASKVITTETTNGKEISETPIIVNGKTVIIKELYPQVSGVLIVAEGANNIAVRTKIQQATASLLDINVKQIKILAMK